MRTEPPGLARLVAACASGGAVGALARWGLAQAWPGSGTRTEVLATLVVNLLGCLLLGALLASASGQDPVRRAFLGAGVLGGFTTFSAYALQVETVTSEGAGAAATGYGVVTVVCCLAAAHLGRRWGERRHGVRLADEQGDA